MIKCNGLLKYSDRNWDVGEDDGPLNADVGQRGEILYEDLDSEDVLSVEEGGSAAQHELRMCDALGCRLVQGFRFDGGRARE